MQSNLTPSDRGEAGREPWRHSLADPTLPCELAPQAPGHPSATTLGVETLQRRDTESSASSLDCLLRIRILNELLSVKALGAGPNSQGVFMKSSTLLSIQFGPLEVVG